MTTARKAVTLLLSYLIFTKPLTEQHGTGLLLIAMGITLKLLPDTKPTKRVAASTTISKTGKDEEECNTGLDHEAEEENKPLI